MIILQHCSPKVLASIFDRLIYEVIIDDHNGYYN